MLTNVSLNVDPSDILGLSSDASLEQIRDAYRAKAKRHHPDAGGEEWAFRLVAQAYELMSTARVARASEREAQAAARPRPTAHASNGHARHKTPNDFQSSPRGSSRPVQDPTESVRRGVYEPAAETTQIVDVEKFSIRFQSEGVWLISERATEDRFLSCCLNVTWPSPGVSAPPALIESSDKILQDLTQVFDAVDVHSKANTSNISVVDHRFSGWLSYPTTEQATAAFNLLRERLHGVGLVVNQWSRDLVIPRQWK